MDLTYWRKQSPTKPLYPDIEWSKPERRDQSGKLLIVGGNKLGFAAVAENYQLALDAGVGEVKVLLPDCLKRAVPPTMTDVIFASCNASGGLNADAKPELLAAASWASGVVLIGDAGRNSETAVLYEQCIETYKGQLTITRDAIDLLRNSAQTMVERDNTLIVASLSQAQKLFQGVYYPKMLTFNMQLLQLVEALHKFTTTYPCAIVTLHHESIIIAHGGTVVTQPWNKPMSVWRGGVATKAAAYWLWNTQKLVESAATSLHA